MRDIIQAINQQVFNTIILLFDRRFKHRGSQYPSILYSYCSVYCTLTHRRVGDGCDGGTGESDLRSGARAVYMHSARICVSAVRR